MKIGKEKFIKEKTKSEEFYKKLGVVRCPYFGEDIFFNAKGLEHLKFKRKNHARATDDQFIRLKLLHLAHKILKLSRTVQGISNRNVFELLRVNNRNEYKMISAQYFEFVAVIDSIRVRIVVKQIGTSPKYFWSIIPFWKVSKEKGSRKTHNGNPEED